jgi:hypothetical protein
MPALTTLDEKLGEVLGLAQAGQAAAKKVATLARKEHETDLVSVLKRMADDAKELEEGCKKVAASRDGVKTAITKKARETKGEITDFMATYLEGAEALDGLEFLSMAEAGELIHLKILGKLNETAKDKDVAALVKRALPVQEGHVAKVHDESLRLAADEDPAEEA